jgi:hypothetical protein
MTSMAHRRGEHGARRIIGATETLSGDDAEGERRDGRRRLGTEDERHGDEEAGALTSGSER